LVISELLYFIWLLQGRKG